MMSAPVTPAAQRRIRGFLLTTVSHTTHTMRSWASETHRQDELVWSTVGVMRVHAGDAVWTVPQQRAVWVPAGVPHTIEVSADTILQATFVAPGAAPHLPPVPTVVELLPAIRELLLLNASTPLPRESRLRLQELVLDLLRPSPAPHVDLRMPLSPRLLRIAERIVAAPAAADTTAEWAARAGTSPRELSRAFAAETGLSLTQWRIRARVRASIVLLGSGHTVAATARRVGYANPSTFIEHFRAVMGSTPAAHFAERPVRESTPERVAKSSTSGT